MTKKIITSTLTLLILASISFYSYAQPAARTVQDFDNNWKFYLGNADDAKSISFNDASWHTLNLPHDWSIELPFDSTSPTGNGGGALRGGIGWYRKTFTVPASSKEKHVFIDFDGVYMNSEVFINGHSLSVRPNGYISFRYDLTPYLKFDNEKNIIAVKISNDPQPNSRWYSGSGIYRHVWLTVTNPVHIEQWGVYITTREVSESAATINISTNITGSENLQGLKLRSRILDAKDKVVSETETPINQSTNQPDNNTNTIAQSMRLPHPTL